MRGTRKNFTNTQFRVAYFRGDLNFYRAVREIQTTLRANHSTIPQSTLMTMMDTFDLEDLIKEPLSIKRDLAETLVGKRNQLCFIGVKR
jgi:hypothetical protein